MRRDLSSKEDIISLVDLFYERVLQDSELRPFFTDVVQVNWEKHLPLMYRFWENILFHTGSYTGNPMQVHKQVHQKCPIREHHYKKWISLFHQTVDDLFEGELAETAKQRAQSIATVMLIKLQGHPEQESIY
ncbi:MAG TPA: group III truncated hemoglobin [Lacibacter sp.]|nr:group III truncated hemoglobin [Lacibacter sp.]HMO89280.1 group III truncated hemoglobin [Lacibacter sp.]HMP85769.1 group III truncated hemoglobin [Lacibacter sp.]